MALSVAAVVCCKHLLAVMTLPRRGGHSFRRWRSFLPLEFDRYETTAVRAIGQQITAAPHLFGGYLEAEK